MKIVIAPDSFKGSLTAREAASAIELGVRTIRPDAEIDTLPMADGGDGTLEALVSSTSGKFLEAEAVGPLGRSIHTRYGILGNRKTAVIEMASVSGLLLLNKTEHNPLNTSTFGTGQLIRHALESGFTELLVCLGGSSTNDGGTGMAQALGVRFLKKDGTEIQNRMCGGLLGEVADIDTSGLLSSVHVSHIIGASDVKNPLLGEYGCSLMYSGQKGATPEMAGQLEKNMRSFIDIAERRTGKNVRTIPGAGAAGGLGAGLMLFLEAELRWGIEIILDACNFSERIQGADLILTGEGKIDQQTAFGKTIAGIALRAKAVKVPVLAFCGIVEHKERLLDLGIKEIIPICHDSMPGNKAMKNAAVLLQKSVEQVMRRYKKSSAF